jgi:hypothetical protein
MRARWGSLLTAALFSLCAPLPAAAAPTGSDPGIEGWEGWSDPVSCEGGLPFDPIAVFSGPADAERGSAAPERALASYLRNPELPWVARRDWRLIAKSGSAAEFVHGRLADGLEWMSFERRAGRWRQSGYARSCVPSVLVDGQRAITWSFDRRQPPPRPGARFVRLELDGSCGGDGGHQTKRAHVDFDQIGRRLLLRVWLDPLPPGPYPCAEVEREPPLKVRLPGRLGNRVLYDGGRFPPVPAGRA